MIQLIIRLLNQYDENHQSRGFVNLKIIFINYSVELPITLQMIYQSNIKIKSIYICSNQMLDKWKRQSRTGNPETPLTFDTIHMTKTNKTNIFKKNNKTKRSATRTRQQIQVLMKCKNFMFRIRHPQYYSYDLRSNIGFAS